MDRMTVIGSDGKERYIVEDDEIVKFLPRRLPCGFTEHVFTDDDGRAITACRCCGYTLDELMNPGENLAR